MYPVLIIIFTVIPPSTLAEDFQVVERYVHAIKGLVIPCIQLWILLESFEKGLGFVVETSILFEYTPSLATLRVNGERS